MKQDAKTIEKKSQDRVRYIIDNFCGGNRMEFSRRTGIGKSSISQYVNRTNAPSNITAAKIGDAFSVNPMWVMGFDVPMEEPPKDIAAFNTLYLTAKENDLNGAVDLLDSMIKQPASQLIARLNEIAVEMNDEGIRKLIQYAEDIKDKYKKGAAER